MIRSPHKLTVIWGSYADLPCVASYHPFISTNYTWYYQASDLDQKHVVKIGGGKTLIMDEGTMRISRIIRNDSGIYTCDVSSRGGNFSRSATHKVIGEWLTDHVFMICPVIIDLAPVLMFY